MRTAKGSYSRNQELNLSRSGKTSYIRKMSTHPVGNDERRLSPFVESGDLFDSPDQLRTRAAESGYLFFRDIVDNESILRLRRDITRIVEKAGWLDDGTDPFDAISTQEAKLASTSEFTPIYDAIQRLESFHTMAHDPGVIGVASSLLGEPAMPHPSAIARIIFPTRLEYTTPPHQDFILVQGTPEVWTCWVPLGTCDHELGGLAVLEGSHLRGILPVHEAKGAGKLSVEQGALDGEWHSSPFGIGDALFFHSKTVHQGLPNVSENRVRLSVDYGYQKATDLIMEKNLGVHQGRLTWKEVYEGWTSDEYQYYWEKYQRESAPQVPPREFG